MNDTGGHLDIWRYLGVLSRGKFLILTFCLSSALTSLALTYVFSEKYATYTTVMYRPQEVVTFQQKIPEALGFPPPLVPLETIGNTLEQVAKSDAALGKIVRRLRLDEAQPKPAGSWFGAVFREVKNTVKEWGGNLWQILKHGRILEKDAFAGAMANLQKNLGVERGTKTYTFRLEAVANDPLLAAAIVDTAAEVLAASMREENTRAARAERERIGERLQENEREIQAVREELERFKGEARVASLSEELSLHLRSLSRFEAELTEVKNELQAALEKFTLQHPEVEALLAKEAGLQEAIARERLRVAELTAKEPQFRELVVRLEALEASYKLVAQAFEESRIAESRAASELSILHRAPVPSAPARPIKILHVGASAVLSLLLAIGAAFLFDFFDPSLRSIEQVEDGLQLTVLATVPPFAKARAVEARGTRPGAGATARG